MQFPLFHLVWNCFLYYDSCEVLDEDSSRCRDELCLWIVGISFKIYIYEWPKEAQQGSSLLGLFCFMLLVDLRGFFFEPKGFRCQTVIRHPTVDLFIGSSPDVDKLLFFSTLFWAQWLQVIQPFFTDMFVLNSVNSMISAGLDVRSSALSWCIMNQARILKSVAQTMP